MDKNMKDIIEMFTYIKGKVESIEEKLEERPTREEVKEIVRAEVGRVESKLGTFENHEVDKRKQLEVHVSKLERV
ncbi:MAG: hypothetical protein A2854_01015 [Parcubacteria group bacterium RIFCSPHIGHO2_01_FULL_56_18]|nr:MAG: hypothetical protein A2854_01015 [Parcubacteria group bacterium RIFCSPHIGHO2_01_FULL_56_18]